MNKLIVGIVSGILGMTAGAVGGYIYAKKKLEEELVAQTNERFDEEVERLRSQHQELLDKEKKVQKEKQETLDRELADLNSYKRAMYISKKQVEQGEVPDIDFSELSSTGTIIESAQPPKRRSGFTIPKSYEEVQQTIVEKRRNGELPPESEEEEDTDDPGETVEDSSITDDEDIEIISMMEYANLPHWYSLVNMDYTIFDSVLIDEDGTVLDDPENYIGEEALTIEEVGTVYIRNDRLKLAIEVQYLATDYQTYLGM